MPRSFLFGDAALTQRVCRVPLAISAACLVACGSADSGGLGVTGPNAVATNDGSGGTTTNVGSGGSTSASGATAAGGGLTTGGAPGAGGGGATGGTPEPGSGGMLGSGGASAGGASGQCPLPLTKWCGSSCVPMTASVGCSSVGCAPCPAVANANATCQAQQCGFRCKDGFVLSGVECVVAPACSDGVKNGSETDVDCGGSCAPCADGLACVTATDCASGSCSDTTCAAAGPATNLLHNPGFENGMSAWTTKNASAVNTAGAARSGTFAAELDDGGDPSEGSLVQDVAAQAGATYTFSAWGKWSAATGTEPTGAWIDVRCYSKPDGKGTKLSDYGFNFTTEAAYTEFTKTFTAPDGTASIEAFAWKDDGNRAFYVDDFGLTSP